MDSLCKLELLPFPILRILGISRGCFYGSLSTSIGFVALPNNGITRAFIKTFFPCFCIWLTLYYAGIFLPYVDISEKNHHNYIVAESLHRPKTLGLWCDCLPFNCQFDFWQVDIITKKSYFQILCWHVRCYVNLPDNNASRLVRSLFWLVKYVESTSQIIFLLGKNTFLRLIF